MNLGIFKLEMSGLIMKNGMDLRELNALLNQASLLE